MTRTDSVRSIDLLEPFRRGAMVHFAHQLANGLAEHTTSVRLLGSADLEVGDLARRYRHLEVFDIPRPDLEGGAVATSRSGMALERLRRLQLFVTQYRKAVGLAGAGPGSWALVATVFRYPMMPWFLGRLQARGVRCAQICHEFEMREVKRSPLSRALRRLNQDVYTKFDAIFFLSESQRERFTGVNPDIDSSRLFVVPMGNAAIFDESRSAATPAEVAADLGLDPERPAVLFVGRLREDKGVFVTIDAFARLSDEAKARRPQLLLAGHVPPNLSDVLQRRITDLGLDDDVVLSPGYVPTDQLGALHEHAQIALYPYLSASQSAALQVGLYFGATPVVSDVGGLPETIDDGRNGLVVPPGDADALAAAVSELLSDDARREQLGEAARQTALVDHSWSAIAAQIVDSMASVPPLPHSR